MLRSLFGTDWRESSAHLKFLSEFRHPCDAEDLVNSDGWKEALKESPQQAIKRFVDEGMLTEQLVYKLKASQFKDLLKQRGLPMGGSKKDMAARLFQADPVMKMAVAGVNVFCCSEQGRAIAQRFVTDEVEKRNEVEQQVVDALRQRRFKEASQLVYSFEAEQVFPRGMNIDWKNRDPGQDVEILGYIFGSLPKLLANLKRDSLDQLRVVAGMMHLWGGRDQWRWLPADIQTGLDLEAVFVAQMIDVHAEYRCAIAEYQRAGVRTIKILTANDSYVCASCEALAANTYKLSNVPELPCEKCTTDGGCRCWVDPARL